MRETGLSSDRVTMLRENSSRYHSIHGHSEPRCDGTWGIALGPTHCVGPAGDTAKGREQFPRVSTPTRRLTHPEQESPGPRVPGQVRGIRVRPDRARVPGLSNGGGRSWEWRVGWAASLGDLYFK